MRCDLLRTIGVAVLGAASLAPAADPTFLKRSIANVSPQADDLTNEAKGASYRPLFGAGDPQARYLKSIARYGELTVDAGGNSALVTYPAEEQIYFILSGAGAVTCDGESVPVKVNDFLYLPPGSRHGVMNRAADPLRLLVMGFRIPSGATVAISRRLMIANTADVPLEELAGHGPTTNFRLLMGTTESTRDKLPAASQMVSLFLMDFAPGGTNIPHHHEMEEEACDETSHHSSRNPLHYSSHRQRIHLHVEKHITGVPDFHEGNFLPNGAAIHCQLPIL